MLKIGLTGGIASGKSTVCKLFGELGVAIIDADIIARQLVAPGQPTLALLANAFGDTIINTDGTLNRPHLRERIFNDPAQRQQLNAIMHPLVYAEIDAAVARLTANYCLIVIPLLLETQKSHIVDRILVIDCPETTQLQRLMSRDKIAQAEALAMIGSQFTRTQRLAKADDVIDNSTDAEHLAEQVKSLHNSYLLLATARTTLA
jgi:dephospho-CoA kinase